MIIVFKPNSPEAEIKKVEKMVSDMGYEPRLIRGVEHTVLGAVGDENMHMSLEALRNLPCIEDVHPIQKKYKLASREFHPDNSVFKIGKEEIGGKKFQIIAGPCAIESAEQMDIVASTLTADGVGILRGGAFKPRTSPYDFQGLGQKGLEILQAVKDKYDVPVVTEVVGIPTIQAVAEVADCIQIGARNCQNYNLLENVAKAGRPFSLTATPQAASSSPSTRSPTAEITVSQGISTVSPVSTGDRRPLSSGAPSFIFRHRSLPSPCSTGDTSSRKRTPSAMASSSSSASAGMYCRVRR